ncbi:MAG: LapA family protein [Thermodesulfobacteriota bacterium]|nr:LapA family protein [Thermodesulfobacteriota bacterium]
MKKIKIGFWLIVIGLIALVIYQNRDFIFIQHHFGVDLLFVSYQTPEWPNIVILLGFMVVGFLAAYIPGLTHRFRSNKTVKELNRRLKTYSDKINALERELNTLKKPAPPEPEPEPAPDGQDTA